MSISSSKSASNVPRNLGFVKQYFKNPMTLVIAILAIVSIVAQFMLSSAATEMSEQLAAALAAMNQSGEITESSGGGIPLGYIISGAVAICIFMIFVSSLSSNGGPTLWFTILHGMSVCELLLTALLALFTVVMEIVFIFSAPTLVKYIVGQDLAGAGNLGASQIEQITRQVDAMRPTLLVGLAITLVIFGVVLYFINSQTAFLKSVELTCKNPQLKSKGAVPYGNISMFIGVLQLIGVVIFYLTVGTADTSALSEMGIEVSLDFSSIITPYMIYAISGALYIVLRGYFAKGWEAFAKENESAVYESVGASTRLSDASPMPTYKSTTRTSHEARQQSQPYLIGEEEDPNKKSSYIPEELQNDYPDPMYDQQGGQFGGDMYGNPYGQQGGQFGGDMYGNPYGQQGGQFGGDPFAGADPFAQSPMGGNPYGDPYNPGGQQGGGYNNGMM